MVNSLAVALFSLICFVLAYRSYGRFIANRVFGINPDRPTPAHELQDGIDYVPTDRRVLWGHHFTSIAGAAPIVGPAIAVVWGWVPALIWVVAGSIFLGAVHDLGALVVSVRHRGRSVGELTGGIVSKRSRILFLLAIFFLLWVVLAVFALVIGQLFVAKATTVVPTWAQMVLAVAVGLAIYRWKMGVAVPGLVALVLLYALIWVGVKAPVTVNALTVPQGHWAAPLLASPVMVWVVIVLAYSFVASVLPVWVLLQPRDFINACQLVVAMVLLYGGVLLSRPPIVAPAFRAHVPGAPPLVPMLFVTIACGAISGFHSLVSSGTSAKQLNTERDARFVGYGAMLAEGALAVVALLACAAAFPSRGAWAQHYADWGAAEGGALKAFIVGAGRLVGEFGLSQDVASTFVALVVVAFSMTTIDTAARLQRYVIGELGESVGLPFLANRYVASTLAVGTALLLAMTTGGQGKTALWPIFGAANQLLAGLALTVITVWLVRSRRPARYTAVPMVFMLAMTGWAMVYNIRQFHAGGNWLLVFVAGALLALSAWLVVEAAVAWRRALRGAAEGPMPEPAAGEEAMPPGP